MASLKQAFSKKSDLRCHKGFSLFKDQIHVTQINNKKQESHLNVAN